MTRTLAADSVRARRASADAFPCPLCGAGSAVIDSRQTLRGRRRRRGCVACGTRFTTHEEVAYLGDCTANEHVRVYVEGDVLASCPRPVGAA